MGIMCPRLVLNLFVVEIFLVFQCLRYISQDLVSFVKQQLTIVEEQSKTIKTITLQELSITNERQSVLNEELMVTIDEQSTLIQQLKEETGMRLSCLL